MARTQPGIKKVCIRISVGALVRLEVYCKQSGLLQEKVPFDLLHHFLETPGCARVLRTLTAQELYHSLMLAYRSKEGAVQVSGGDGGTPDFFTSGGQ